MSKWDIFHSGRLEVQRGLSVEEVRAALAGGAILEDDLARPAGSSDPWARIADLPGLMEGPSTPEPAPSAPDPTPPAPQPPGQSAFDTRPFDVQEADIAEEVNPLEVIFGPEEEIEDDGSGSVADTSAGDEAIPSLIDRRPEVPGASPGSAEVEGEDEHSHEYLSPAMFGAPADASPIDEDSTRELPRPEAPPTTPPPTPPLQPPAPDPFASGPMEVDDEGVADEVPVLPEPIDLLEEDEAVAEFTLAATPGEPAEEIDLTAMVDVAFQLVLFFLVTATTIYYKTLEIPNPDPEESQSVAQEMRTLEELMEEYILVEIDPEGRLQVDRQPIDPAELVARLSRAREDTSRSSMLLMADFATPHANAVLAYDAANELGLAIAVARPVAPGVEG